MIGQIVLARNQRPKAQECRQVKAANDENESAAKSADRIRSRANDAPAHVNDGGEDERENDDPPGRMMRRPGTMLFSKTQ